MIAGGPVTEMTSTGSVTTTVAAITVPVKDSKQELEIITTKETTSGSVSEMMPGESETERTSGVSGTIRTEETITRSVMPDKEAKQESKRIITKEMPSGGSKKEIISTGRATDMTSNGAVTTITKTTMPVKVSMKELETKEITSGGTVTNITTGGSATEKMSGVAVTEITSGDSAATTVRETITRSAMPIKESIQESKTVTTKEIASGGPVTEMTSDGSTAEITSLGSTTQTTSSAACTVSGVSVPSAEMSSGGTVTTITKETSIRSTMPIKESKQESKRIVTKEMESGSVREMTSGDSMSGVISGGSFVAEKMSGGDIIPSTERTETIITTTKPTKESMKESKTVTTTKITSGGPVTETTSDGSVQSTETIKRTKVSSVTQMKSGGSLEKMISGGSERSSEIMSGGSFESQSTASQHFDEVSVRSLLGDVIDAFC